MFDIIIVGGGIAGLYAQYNIRKMSPETHVLLLESSSREHLGGRASNILFHGTSVVTGAGIGRKNKDTLLKELMQEMNLPIHEFTTGHDFPRTMQSNHCNVKSIFMMLRKEYKQQSDKGSAVIHKTFKEFATSFLGEEIYNQFIVCAGYTDYENEDIHDTLYNYGFEDNFTNFTGFSVSWKQLVENLAKTIGSRNIITNTYVKKIKQNNEGFSIYAETLNENICYLCKKVIVATTIDSVIKMLPKEFYPIYKQIHGQPFLRVYGKFSKKSTEIMSEFAKSHVLVVPGPLQKIIPMNAEKGIYMISYSDNKCAISLKRYLKNTATNREHFCRLLEKALAIDKGSLELQSILSCYFDIGTHYYEPLSRTFHNRKEFIKTAQQPYPNMLVVGEMVSMNQGWVEGALDSVDKVLNKRWILT
jgi:hypothetical protein